jgi:hypothetical protein
MIPSRKFILTCFALATAVLPVVASAQDRADKYNYNGIYAGKIPTNFFTGNLGKNRVKSQLVVYPDGRSLVLTVEANSFTIEGLLEKNVFTGQWHANS